jgi:7-cyano-7-deazaguanine reductase
MNNEAIYLGKATEYPKQYAPEVLVPVPRHLNRDVYDLKDDKLPFSGYDVWHAYELSFLTEKGMPVARLLKLVYPADSPFLVESKSLKLYLNSFNMERYGATVNDGLKLVGDTIKKDLEKILKTSVQANFFKNDESQDSDLNDFEILEETPEIEEIEFTDYTENPSILDSKTANSGKTEIKAVTHLLRSNCKVTFQPDWGSAFIYLKSQNIPDKSNLLKYLVSIRNENHFHEEICEMIYKRLWDKFTPEKLMVVCIYTRRGGIDICPVRVNDRALLPTNLTDINRLMGKLLRQ